MGGFYNFARVAAFCMSLAIVCFGVFILLAWPVLPYKKQFLINLKFSSQTNNIWNSKIYFIFFLDVSASIQPTSNQPQPPGANVNNHNACRAEPSAPPPDPAYYIPPPGGGYHPQYPPSNFTNPQYPPSNTNPQYPASTSQRHPLNSGQNPSSTQNAGNDTQNDNDTCVVCLDRRSEILLRPCNHFNLCEVCSRSLNQCPTCRGAIQDKIKPFR